MLTLIKIVNKIKNFFIIKINNFIYFLENFYLSKYWINTKNLNLVFDIGYNLGNFSKTLIGKNTNTKIIAVDANYKLILNSYSHKNIKNFFLMANKKNRMA